MLESYLDDTSTVQRVASGSCNRKRKGQGSRTNVGHAAVKGSYSAMAKLRNRRIAVRVTRDEQELIRWAALNEGVSVSEFIRCATLDRAGKVLVAVEKESA